jgi:CheY-like chemotaxis protein
VSRVVIMHWNAAEAREHARDIAASGHEVSCLTSPVARDLSSLRENPPDVFVISLERVLSAGRDVALALRAQARTRAVPIVFVPGDPEKTRTTQALLPDTLVAPWPGLETAIAKGIAARPTTPVSPGIMAGYSGAPLPRKLGISSGSRVALLHAPRGFRALITPLPEGVRVRSSGASPADVLVLFVSSARELEERFAAGASMLARRGKLWIAWPKKSSGKARDLGERDVRSFGLAAGFVDYKIAALDGTWSGLCFARREGRQTAPPGRRRPT